MCNPPMIRKIGAIPITNALVVQARFVPLSKTDQPYYNTAIVFHGLDFVDTKDQLHPFSVEITRGFRMWMRKPSFNNTKVRVTCTCDDYYWVWWWYNKQREALAWVDFPHPSKVTGHAVRQTDGKPYGTIPGSRNDKKKPGICKHIYRLVSELSRRGTITQ